MNKQQQEALDSVKPICAECKHYDNSDEWEPPLCSRSVATACNVTGRVRSRTCHDERNRGFSDSCGKSGKFFEKAEPKEVWYEKLILWSTI